MPATKTEKYRDLMTELLRLIRVDQIGSTQEPPMLSQSLRVRDDPSGVTYNDGRRYPGSTLVLSPPMAKTVPSMGQLVWMSDCVVSWSFPNWNYTQLPVDDACNLGVTVACKLKGATVRSMVTRVEQLEGTNVWVLQLIMEIEWTQAVAEDYYPELQGAIATDSITIDEVQLGLWRSPRPLNPELSVLDKRLDIDNPNTP